MRRGSAFSAPRCYSASMLMLFCFSAATHHAFQQGCVFQLFFAVFLLGFDLLVVSSNFPRFNLIAALSFHIIWLLFLSKPGSALKPKIPRSFPAILIFGDSTVDTGNNNFISTIFKANYFPYGKNFPGHVSTGRFSDGKLITDMLASRLGIKELVPPFLDPKLSDDDVKTGVSFASAGTGYDNLTTLVSGVIPAWLSQYGGDWPPSNWLSSHSTNLINSASLRSRLCGRTKHRFQSLQSEAFKATKEFRATAFWEQNFL